MTDIVPEKDLFVEKGIGSNEAVQGVTASLQGDQVPNADIDIDIMLYFVW